MHAMQHNNYNKMSAISVIIQGEHISKAIIKKSQTSSLT